jgi:hypothetical protein
MGPLSSLTGDCPAWHPAPCLVVAGLALVLLALRARARDTQAVDVAVA